MSLNDERASKLVQFLERHWFEKSGLVAALIATFVTMEGILAAAAVGIWQNVLIVLVFLLAVTTAWCLSQRLPRTKKGCVGFLVSLTCEDDDESRRLRSDFIVPLQKLLKSGNAGGVFQFIELPFHHARTVIDQDDAERVRRITKAHFMLYGQVRKRIVNGVEAHFLDFDGIVAHKPIPETMRKQFSAEFGELLPRRVQIPVENDLLSFQITTEWAGVVTKYIIGIAAAMSGDIEYAEQLYKDAQDSLKAKGLDFIVYRILAERLPIRISELHIARAQATYEAWQIDRDPEKIDQLGEYLKFAIETGATIKPGVHLLNAIQVFLKSRDV
ncbi:MAG: hypothetical protein WCK82_15130, partial [Bacteroidota bacterium]